MAVLLTMQFGIGVETASAASASCNAINAYPTVTWTGSSAGNGNNTSYPIGSFEPGEYVTATFTDNSTGTGASMPGMGDAVFLSRADHTNANFYFSDSGSPGTHVVTASSAFLQQYGLFISIQDQHGIISPATLHCYGAVVALSQSPTAGALPAASYGAGYSQTFVASGGTAPYSYALTGTLPTGMSFSSNGTLSGTPVQAGQYSFSVKATDSAATPNATSFSYTLAVNSVAPSAPQAVSATAQDGQAEVTFAVPASDGGASITAYTVTSAPGGITATGGASPITITGLTNGTAYTFTVTASNPAGTGNASAASGVVTPKTQQTISFVNPGTKDYGTTSALSASASSGLTIVFTSSTTSVCAISGTNQVAGLAPGTCTITASQVGNGAYLAAAPVSQSFAIRALTPGSPTIGGVTAGDASAQVSFTAPANNGGDAISGYTVVSNPGGTTASGSQSPITVTGLTNGTAYIFTVVANNSMGSGTASAASASVTPKAAQTLSFPNPGTRNWRGTSALSASVTSGLQVAFTSDTPGICTILGDNQVFGVAPGTCTVTASQTGNAAYLPATPVAQSFLIAVQGGAVDISTTSVPNATAGNPYTASLAATGGAAPYTWSLIGGLPAGITLSSAGVLSGSAEADGTFILQVRVTDQAAQVKDAHIQLVVDRPNIAITPAGLPSGKQGTPYSQALTAAGGAAPYLFTVTSGALPAGIVLSPSGELVGTSTVSGSFNLQITATDRQGYQASQSYTLVFGENAPTLVADTARTGANAAISIPVTENDAGTITSIAIAQVPAHGTASVDGLSILYTPNQDFYGEDALSYRANGPGGNSQAATVAVTVSAGALPVATARVLTVQAGKSIDIDAAEGASNGPFTAAAVTRQPASGEVSVKGTTLTYTTDAKASGKVTFDYSLSNAFGASAAATVSLQVNPTPSALSINQAAVAGRAATVDLTAGATGGPFVSADVVSVSPASAGTATITATAGAYILHFTAAETFSGNAKVLFTLSNPYAASAVSSVSFAVQGRSDPSKDAEVTGILSAQADATRRMATGQLSNFQQRLEQLHNGQPAQAFSNGITLTSASATTVAMREAGERQHGPSAIQDLSATSSSMAADRAAVSEQGRTAGLLPGGTSVWTGGAINFGKERAGRDASTDFTTSGLSMGADRLLADSLIAGAGLGWANDNTDVGSNGSRSKASAYSVAAYASYRPDATFFTDLVLGYQWLSFDSIRRVTDTGGRVEGSRDGTQWFGSLSMGYLLRTKDIQVTPYGRFDVARASLDGFTERGDDTYALVYQGQHVQTSTASAGVLAQFTVKRDYGVWAPQLRAEYGRDLQGASSALMSYADLTGAGGNLYRASLLQTRRDHALLGGGVSLQTIGGWTMSAEYQVQLESDTGDHQSVRFGLEKKFGN